MMMLYRWIPIINQISLGILLSIGLYFGIYGQWWGPLLAVVALFVLFTSGTTVPKSQDSAWMNYIWKLRIVPIGIVLLGILYSFWQVNREADADDYLWIRLNLPQANAEAKALVQTAMEDDEISNRDYLDIFRTMMKDLTVVQMGEAGQAQGIDMERDLLRSEINK